MVLRVLHIDSGLSWRGGQKQLALLLAHLPRHQVESHVVVPLSTPHAAKFNRAQYLIEKKMGPLSQLKTAYELLTYCGQHQIDLLHAHTSKAHTLAMLVNLLSKKKIPLVVHRHVIFPPTGFVLQRYKYGPRIVSQFIAISTAVEKSLLSYGISPQKITTIKTSYLGPHCEQEDKIQAKRQLCHERGLDAEKPLIGFCAALSEEKGCFDLLTAIALQRKTSGETPQVVIAGEGPLREKISAEILRLKLQDKVILLGFVEEVTTFFAAIDILIFPSTSEGLGLTLLEAAFGLCCVIATQVGGIGEVIIHEKTGVLVAANSPREIVRALGQVLSSPLLRLKYAVNLRAHVKKNFSPEKMVADCSKLYQRLISQR